jgi:hypothetical protein
MEMKIKRVSKPIALSLCMSAWLLAGNAHAANSHLYPAVGCQETFPDPEAFLDRENGTLQTDSLVFVTCPIVTDANSMRITATVFYETALHASPTFAGKPFEFHCTLLGYDPATQIRNSEAKSVHPIVRNDQTVGGSFTLSMEASHQFNVLNCILPGTRYPLLFRVSGYQVDES